MERNAEKIREVIDKAMRHKPRMTAQDRREVLLARSLFAICLIAAAWLGFVAAVGILSVVK